METKLNENEMKDVKCNNEAELGGCAFWRVRRRMPLS